MSASNIINATVDLAKGIQLNRLGRLFASGDKAAHTFNVTVLNDGSAADLSGSTITGYFIRPDEATVTISGTLASNVASITLPADCYIKTGHFSLIVKAISSNTNAAIFFADGTVTRSTTDIIVDPSNIVPSLEELLSQLSAMQEGTTAANEAASSANLAAESASTAATAATDAASDASKAATAASTAAQQVTDAIIPDMSDVTTNTLAAGNNASVVIDTTTSGTLKNPKVTFNIPRGEDGSGAVSTVDGISPVSGNVTLPVMGGTDGTAAGAAGKVPAQATTDAGKFLKADGTWAMPPTYSGATSSAAGTPGLVPSAPSADRLKFLRGDGSWETPSGGGGGGGGHVFYHQTIGTSDWIDAWGNVYYSEIITSGYSYVVARCISGRDHIKSEIRVYISGGTLYFETDAIPSGSIEVWCLLYTTADEYGISGGSYEKADRITPAFTELSISIPSSGTGSWSSGQNWPGGSAPLGETASTCYKATVTEDVNSDLISCNEGDDFKVSEYNQALCPAPLYVYVGHDTIYVATTSAPSSDITISGLILHN